MAKRSDVIDAVVALIPQSSRHLRWHERVSPEHVETIAEIKAAWKSGRLGARRKPAAVGISQYLRANGIANVGHNGVLLWLEEA